MRLFSSRFFTVLFVATTLAFSGHASAQSVPHFSSGSAQFIGDNDFVGTGQATHLGSYTEVGRVSFAATGNPAVLAVTGCATYTAANGDTLRAAISGELNQLTGAITATLTYVPGTGRFADVSGSSSLVGQMLGGGAVRVAVTGNIQF